MLLFGQGFIHFYSSFVQAGPRDYRIYYFTYGATGDRLTAVALSNDTLVWTKPRLHVVPFPPGAPPGNASNNIVFDGILYAVVRNTAPDAPPSARFLATTGGHADDNSSSMVVRQTKQEKSKYHRRKGKKKSRYEEKNEPKRFKRVLTFIFSDCF